MKYLSALITILFIQKIIFAQAPAIDWQKSFGGTQDDNAYSVHQSVDGGFIVAGSTFSTSGQVIGNHGVSDYWVVKTDALGNSVWKKCFGGTLSDNARSVNQTSDGGYIIAGSSLS